MNATVIVESFDGNRLRTTKHTEVRPTYETIRRTCQANERVAIIYGNTVIEHSTIYGCNPEWFGDEPIKINGREVHFEVFDMMLRDFFGNS
jgi:hypothetical protein